MTGRPSAIKRLLEVWDGTVIAPRSLERFVAEFDEARSSTMLNELSRATRADLGDVPHNLAQLPNLSDADTLHLSRRLGWTVSKFAAWERDKLRSALLMEALVASVAAWNIRGDFWEEVRPRLDDSNAAVALGDVLYGRTPSIDIPDDADYSTRESLRALQDANEAQDWLKLSNLVASFRFAPFDIGAHQAIIGLSVLDWPRLVRLVDKIKSYIHGALIINSLSLVGALRLAIESENAYFKFTALYLVANQTKRALNAEENAALEDFLAHLSQDNNNWPGWLGICNHYPVRHPHIQVALGRALARSDDAALQAYVDSISLNISSDDRMRLCVTQCLSEFRSHAGIEPRRALWSAAFNRWQSWNFGADEEQGLTGVVWSSLDYGVVGYLVEGGGQTATSDPDDAFANELHVLESKWHPSATSMFSDFLRLVSSYQVSSFARTRSAGDVDWLPDPRVRVPAAANDFVRRRYEWDL